MFGYRIVKVAVALCMLGAFVFGGSAAVRAQNVEASLKIEKFSMEASFAAPSKKGGNKTIYWYKNGDKWDSFSDADGKRVNISYKGPQKLVFYKKVGEGESDKAFSPVAEIMIPSASREVFVLMISTGSTAQFYPMNVSPDSLPKGKIAVMNMTRRGLALMFGADKKFLKANSHAIFSEAKSKKSISTPVFIAARVEGKWEMSYKSRVSYPDKERCIMLIHDNAAGKPVPSLSVNVVTF